MSFDCRMSSTFNSPAISKVTSKIWQLAYYIWKGISFCSRGFCFVNRSESDNLHKIQVLMQTFKIKLIARAIVRMAQASG